MFGARAPKFAYINAVVTHWAQILKTRELYVFYIWFGNEYAK